MTPLRRSRVKFSIFHNYHQKNKSRLDNACPQKLNKLTNFVHIISESSTSIDPNVADVVHKHLWEII